MRRSDPRLVAEILFISLSGAEANLCALSLFTGNYVVFVSTIFPALIASWCVWRPTKGIFQLCAAVQWLTGVVLIGSLAYHAYVSKARLAGGGRWIAAIAILVVPFLGCAALSCAGACDPSGFLYWNSIRVKTDAVVPARPAEICTDVDAELEDDFTIELPESLIQSERLSETEPPTSPGRRRAHLAINLSPTGKGDNGHYPFAALMAQPVYASRKSAVTSPGPGTRSTASAVAAGPEHQVCVVSPRSSPERPPCSGILLTAQVESTKGPAVSARRELPHIQLRCSPVEVYFKQHLSPRPTWPTMKHAAIKNELASSRSDGGGSRRLARSQLLSGRRSF